MTATTTKQKYPNMLGNLIHSVYPLSLRERLAFRMHDRFNLPSTNITLSFNPKLKMDLSPDDVGHQCIILSGFYELSLTRLLLECAKKGGLLMDVGSNYGYFSLLWTGQNTNNTSIAFEASPKNHAALTRNIQQNNLSKSITLEPIAASDSTGTISFSTMHEGGQTGWGGVNNEHKDHDITIPCITLDDYCAKKNITQIDFLKIDVEGADTMVLRGAKNLLHNKQISMIAFEENLERMEMLHIEKNEALDLLKANGYTIESLGSGEYMAHL
jgi:FkbM family methyltransferase